MDDIVLLTGAAGSIGSALAKSFACSGTQRLILLDQSTVHLNLLRRELLALPVTAELAFVLSDFCEASTFRKVLEQYRPSLIIHAAALKHVAQLERNPLAALRCNSIGTRELAAQVREHGTARIILISTDKAVNPRSIMGASKRVAELAVQFEQRRGLRAKIVRLGNVRGSSGSVLPIFASQIAHGGPVTVTDRQATRFFLSMEQVVEAIRAAATLEPDGGIVVPEMGKPVRILDLAHQMLLRSGQEQRIAISFVGLRAGEKLTEEITSKDETLEAAGFPGLYQVRGEAASLEKFDEFYTPLFQSALRNDLAGALHPLSGMLPEYQPSELLLRQSRSASPVLQ